MIQTKKIEIKDNEIQDTIENGNRNTVVEQIDQVRLNTVEDETVDGSCEGLQSLMFTVPQPRTSLRL